MAAFHARARWKRLESPPTAGKSRILKTRRKENTNPDPCAPVHSSHSDGSSDFGTKSVDDSVELETSLTGQREGMPVAQLSDILSEVRDVQSELVQVRELVGVLVRRGRRVEAKTEIAVRRLDRMEREQDEGEDAVHEVTLQEALTNQTKVVKLVVDKSFVDKGFGFGKAPTGEIVFIHASVVQGAEVLMIGTDAWVQGRKRVETRTRQREGEQGGTTTGLDELAGHIEASNMGAGGSHPQATMMPDPWATYKCPSARDNQAENSAPLEMDNRFPTRCSTSVSHTSSVDTSARSELDV